MHPLTTSFMADHISPYDDVSVLGNNRHAGIPGNSTGSKHPSIARAIVQLPYVHSSQHKEEAFGLKYRSPHVLVSN